MYSYIKNNIFLNYLSLITQDCAIWWFVVCLKPICAYGALYSRILRNVHYSLSIIQRAY